MNLPRVRPLILFYNTFYNLTYDLSGLSETDRLSFTTDRALFEQADAVVFHIPNLELHSLQKPPGQLWVAFSLESNVNYPCLADPEFLRHFDLRMTYERDADIWCSYLDSFHVWQGALALPIPDKTEAAPCVMFQSSNVNESGRGKYVAELMKHIQVDSYGSFLKNRQLSMPDEGYSTKRATIARYKFCLAMENSIAKDYVTEKLFEPLLCGTVPVYLGAPNAEDFVPGDATFVDVRQFPNPRDLADYLLMLTADDEAYREFLRWRQRPIREAFEFDLAQRNWYQNLLQVVRARMLAGDPRSSTHAAQPPLSFDPFLAQAGGPLLIPRLRRFLRSRLDSFIPKW